MARVYLIDFNAVINIWVNANEINKHMKITWTSWENKNFDIC